jgi:hypothetical protein
MIGVTCRSAAKATIMRPSAVVASVSLTLLLMSPAYAQEVTRLTDFGSDDFVTGSTIGPDGALYVADGSAGNILRINLPDGVVSTYATGFPPKAFQGEDIGGPVDVAFVDGTAFVLVTLVSGLVNGEPFGDPEAKNGLYRIEPSGTPTLVADLGQWSIDNPPEPAFFVDTGVQFTMEPYEGGFLVTDAHHNRVLSVEQTGAVKEVATFGNEVPVGLETTGDQFFVALLGPIDHLPEDGKIVSVRAGGEPSATASGASMLIDVEQGPQDTLYALSQGKWDGVGEGSRAEPDTGRLSVVGSDGKLTPVLDGGGQELVLDRPTSIEFVGNTAYVVSVTGDVYRVDGL